MDGAESRNLRVRCSTWDQVEAFYATKLKGGRTLTIKVPFTPRRGEPIALVLGLPNDVMISVDGEITGVKAAPDGKQSLVRIELHGLTDHTLEQLKKLVADARVGHGASSSASQSRRHRRVSGPPPAAPIDAPINELVEQPVAPDPDTLEEAERDVFLALEAELRTMRQAAAHEVLGVSWDATVGEIRAGYFRLTKCYHPDNYAKHRSSAVMQLSSELFIHINRAYDRMRQAAAAAGKAIIAGPALLAHDGWVAGFDDIAPAEPRNVVTPRPKSAVHVHVPARGTQRGRPVTAPVGPVTVSFSGAPVQAAGSAPSEEPDAGDPISESSLFGDLEEASQQSEPSQVGKLLASRRGSREEQSRAEQLGERGRELMRQHDFRSAQVQLAEALRLDARNRALRALYHVATGHLLVDDGKRVEGMTQFETALAHDPSSELAQAALEGFRDGGTKQRKSGLFKRFFEK